MKRPRISCFDTADINDADMLAEFDRCRREGKHRASPGSARHGRVRGAGFGDRGSLALLQHGPELLGREPGQIAPRGTE